MKENSMQNILNELVSLAPTFFSSNIIHASESDIVKAEEAARTIFSDSHRTLLRFMGGTKAGALDPFLMGRSYDTETIASLHEEMKDEPLPPDVVCFLWCEGELLWLKHGRSISEDPLIGGIGDDYSVFYPNITQTPDHLLEWFRMQVTEFRLEQPDYRVSWNGPKNSQRWGEPQIQSVAVLHRLGFQSSPSHPNCTHLVRGTTCATVHSDASATLACDDMDEIKHIMAILSDHTPVEGLYLQTETDRPRSPRE